MRLLLLSLTVLLLAACGEAPAAALPPPTSVAETATAALPGPTAVVDAVAQLLAEQLRADEVVVQRVEWQGSAPATLTIEYTLNDLKVAASQQPLDVSLTIERERSVHAITRRVLAQTAGGVAVERVVLLEHIGGLDAQGSVVQVADMQAWERGELDDNQYHARWCCTPP